MRYRVSSDTYNDWTNQWYHSSVGGSFSGQETYVAHDHMSSFFIALSSKRYAFNTGTHDIDSVYAEGTIVGGRPWSDSYQPSTSFAVCPESGTHPVFFCSLSR